MIENIKEVILCKYGEVVLKGANRSDFEKKMLKEFQKQKQKKDEPSY
jgi:adenylyl- and sulfurtransferase ThiI